MNTQLCVVGTVATEPRYLEGAGKVPVCSFRIACNERRYDRVKGEWVDGETNWFSMSAFRSLAVHARDSFAIGDRVIVTGRLRVRNWESGEKSGTSVDIEADAIGHDVRWGVSTFRKHRVGAADTPEHRDDEGDETRELWGADSVPTTGESIAPAAEEGTLVTANSDGFTPTLP